MREALRRLAVATTLVAASAATFPVGPAFGQDPGTGRKDAGESGSPWHGIFAFLGWILLSAAESGAFDAALAQTPPPRRPTSSACAL